MEKQPQRTVTIKIRVSTKEHAAITKAAIADGRYVSSWGRYVMVTEAKLSATKEKSK